MFIVIEWLDGSGKGTQTKLVTERLEAEWKKVLVLDYPCYWQDSSYFIEKYLNGAYGKNVWAKRASLFFALDRFDDSFNFVWEIDQYDHIISNRYVSSSMIHHGGKIRDDEKRLDYVKWLDDLEYEILGMLRPDTVLFLDVPPRISQKLVEKKEARAYIEWWRTKDIHEADPDHFKNTYEAAEQMLKVFSDWERVDCCENSEILSPEIITEKILTYFH